jgi:hypothetical protein
MQPVQVARPHLFERFSATTARDERLCLPASLRRRIVAVPRNVDSDDVAT